MCQFCDTWRSLCYWYQKRVARRALPARVQEPSVGTGASTLHAHNSKAKQQ